ncbi:hypothetical protein RZQ20_25720 [Raoultella ornithinolytica]|nr:hypothetical protein [Raoultella ornithinolytica]MDV1095664.1 hypothetical protein [Raoultella ornithinolytica]MDV1123215.1 hypothetical protein [Raoultella ornithinolytica]
MSKNYLSEDSEAAVLTLCVHSVFPGFWWLIHLSVSSLAANGKEATT